MAERGAAWLGRTRAQVGRVLLGKEREVDLLLAALLAGGHVLVEDVPGVGKTTLVKAVARSLALSFRRIQCTPDLLPSDVTGITYFDPGERAFRFRPGPVFAHVLLVDEINRATPRTQSSLLEAMEERQVTVDGETHPLEAPFWVVATQNPVESQGTYPLPEAELDRFLVRLRLGYPDAADERTMLALPRPADPVADLLPQADAGQVLAAQAAAASVHLSEAVAGYIVALAQATRDHPQVALGASPRACLALARMARALAWMAGRDYVLPDDVQALAVPVFAHRLLLAVVGHGGTRAADDVVAEVVARTPAPREAPWPERP
ncbi:MAG: AAA family ATPase [Firmicutes bacterium]|nr:AAA family ATPase [Bacillota bacterium]